MANYSTMAELSCTLFAVSSHSNAGDKAKIDLSGTHLHYGDITERPRTSEHSQYLSLQYEDKGELFP